MKFVRMVLSAGILLAASACGLVRRSSKVEVIDPEEIDAAVNGTLTAIASDAGPTTTPTVSLPEEFRPVWLDDLERITGEGMPPELYGLTYRKVAVWLVDEEGLVHGVMGQPFEGTISPDGTGYLMSTDRPNGGDILYYNIASTESSKWTDTPNLSEANYQ